MEGFNPWEYRSKFGVQVAISCDDADLSHGVRTGSGSDRVERTLRDSAPYAAARLCLSVGCVRTGSDSDRIRKPLRINSETSRFFLIRSLPLPVLTLSNSRRLRLERRVAANQKKQRPVSRRLPRCAAAKPHKGRHQGLTHSRQFDYFATLVNVAPPKFNETTFPPVSLTNPITSPFPPGSMTTRIVSF